VRFYILVNGTPSGFFFFLALVVCDKEIFFLLFWFVVVIMEALSRMLIAALDQGNLTGFSMGSREYEALVVNHFLSSFPF
jgi:hypothetical protein